MNGRRAEFLIDLQKIKAQKQKKINDIFADLYEWMFIYLQTETNLREKVRAKQLFRHKLDLNKEEVLDNDLQVHLEHWLLLDYVTVAGSRLLDIFVRTKQEKMSKEMLELSGILMLMHFEPVKVIGVEKEVVTYDTLFGDGTDLFQASPFLFSVDVNPDQLALIRTATIGFEKKIIGPSIIIDPSFESKVAGVFKDVHDQGYHVWRRYFKEYGIDMLKYRKKT
ncbi:hypothetical protein HXA35_15150 [Bacillus sp. A301a_S52]|nr:hypothetical protein [Bacillus sp. A301a_S52]